MRQKSLKADDHKRMDTGHNVTLMLLLLGHMKAVGKHIDLN